MWFLPNYRGYIKGHFREGIKQKVKFSFKPIRKRVRLEVFDEAVVYLLSGIAEL